MARKLKPTTVRFTPVQHALLTEYCEATGVSLGQFVRDATLARWAWELGHAAGAEGRDIMPAGAALAVAAIERELAP